MSQRSIETNAIADAQLQLLVLQAEAYRQSVIDGNRDNELYASKHKDHGGDCHECHGCNGIALAIVPKQLTIDDVASVAVRLGLELMVQGNGYGDSRNVTAWHPSLLHHGFVMRGIPVR